VDLFSSNHSHSTMTSCAADFFFRFRGADEDSRLGSEKSCVQSLTTGWQILAVALPPRSMQGSEDLIQFGNIDSDGCPVFVRNGRRKTRPKVFAGEVLGNRFPGKAEERRKFFDSGIFPCSRSALYRIRSPMKSTPVPFLPGGPSRPAVSGCAERI